MITKLMGDLIEGAINNLSDEDIDAWLKVGKKLQRYFKINNFDDIAMGTSDYAPSDASNILKFDEVVTDMGAHIPFAYEYLDSFGTMLYFANEQNADDWEEAMIAKENEGIEESLEVSDKLIAVDSKQKAYHQFLRGEKKLDAFKKEAEKAECKEKACYKKLKEGYDSDLTMDEVASYIQRNFDTLDEIAVDEYGGLWKDYEINYRIYTSFYIPMRIVVSIDDDTTHSYREFRFAEYDDWMMCLDDAFSPETIEDLERLISERLGNKFTESLKESDGWDADTEEDDRNNRYISFEDDDYSPMNDDRPEWEKDIEWSNIYGGNASYCRKCHGKLEYDSDGDLACPDCQPSRFEREEDETVPADWNGDDNIDDFDFDAYWGNYPNDPMYDPADTSRDDGYGFEDDYVEESLGNFCAANVPIEHPINNNNEEAPQSNEVDMNAYGDPEDDEF